jgi:hypothetical protein
MQQPTWLQAPTIERIPQVLAQIYQGAIQVPRFQRRYVWTVEQRLELLQSIKDGLPIGSILLWRTRSRELPIEDFRTVLPTKENPFEFNQYILDGHQRLATLYRALAPGFVRASEAEPREPTEASPDEDDDGGLFSQDEWPIYYDLEAEQFEVIPLARRAKLGPNWVRLDTLLDPAQMFDAQRRIFDDPKLSKRLAYRVEHLAARFKDYLLPTVVLATDDLEVVTTTFKRVNSAGTPMDEADMVASLSWARGVKLHEQIAQIQADIEELDWGLVEPKTIIQTAKALAGLDVTRTEPEKLRDRIAQDNTLLPRTREALLQAVQFLRDQCHIPSVQFLPYSIQLVLIAQHMTPQNVASGVLYKWFWHMTYIEWFSVVNGSHIKQSLEALDFYEMVLGDFPASYTPEILLASVQPYEQFHLKAARAKAWAIRLAEMQPLDLGGRPLPALELLRVHGSKALVIWGRDLANYVQPVPARTVANRLLLDPTTARCFLKTLYEAPRSIPKDVLMSHFWSEGAINCILADDFSGALMRRFEIMNEMEVNFTEKMRFNSDWATATP